MITNRPSEGISDSVLYECFALFVLTPNVPYVISN